MLGQASMGRGLPGMVSPVRPGPNAYDQGGASKPSVNTQPFNNERLAMQSRAENARTATNQAVVDATGKVRAANAEQTDSTIKAQQMLTERMAEALEANGSGQALFEMSQKNGIERAQFDNDIYTSQLIAANMSPDLGAYAASANQYNA